MSDPNEAMKGRNYEAMKDEIKKGEDQVYYIDAETSKAIENIQSGSLAKAIKMNMKYSLSGVGIGAAAGILIATFTKQCRLCYGFWGAVGGGVLGYVVSPKKEGI